MYGAPSELSARKSLSQLDAHCRNFIERSPFLCLSTAAADGTADVSPRGDAPGFVRVLDDHALLIPDRLGNNRIDSLRNVLQNANVGLLFLVPGVDETLRVNGLAQVVVRSTLLEACAVNGKVPNTGLFIEVRDSSMAHFLTLQRATFLSMLQEKLGDQSVAELRFSVGRVYQAAEVSLPEVLPAPDRATQLTDQIFGRRHADIAGQQSCFQFREKRFIDFAMAE